MISVDRALEIVRAHCIERKVDSIPLRLSAGRTLAKDIVAPFSFPRFDNSAMDGYAVGGPIGPWRLTGEVAAGDSGSRQLGEQEAVRIFTGAPVPSGCYAVVPQEETEMDEALVHGTAQAGAHIRRAGEELAEGAQVAPRGVRIQPPMVGALASIGLAEVPVHCAPSVALLSTGNEIAQPGQPLKPGQVYDSNATAIAAWLRQIGCEVQCTHCVDDPLILNSSVIQIVDSNNLLITSGGVSVGSYDFVRTALEGVGFKTLFHGVAMKPGKPIAFGIREDGKAWLGLPGNPMSAWVGFLLFGLTLLGEEMKRDCLPLAKGIRRRAGREEFIPFSLSSKGEVELRGTVGSHSCFGLVGSHGLVRIDAATEELAAGDRIHALHLPWSGIS